jgi:hypothetical protein
MGFSAVDKTVSTGSPCFLGTCFLLTNQALSFNGPGQKGEAFNLLSIRFLGQTNQVVGSCQRKDEKTPLTTK